MLELFYKTFLETTDPYTGYDQLFSFKVTFSILVNAFLYFLAYFILTHLFNFSKKYVLFAGGILVVMILGYFGRLARTKSIYNVLLEEHDKAKAREKAMKIIRKSYFTWYFLG